MESKAKPLQVKKSVAQLECSLPIRTALQALRLCAIDRQDLLGRNTNLFQYHLNRGNFMRTLHAEPMASRRR